MTFFSNNNDNEDIIFHFFYWLQLCVLKHKRSPENQPLAIPIRAKGPAVGSASTLSPSSKHTLSPTTASASAVGCKQRANPDGDLSLPVASPAPRLDFVAEHVRAPASFVCRAACLKKRLNVALQPFE